MRIILVPSRYTTSLGSLGSTWKSVCSLCSWHDVRTRGNYSCVTRSSVTCLGRQVKWKILRRAGHVAWTIVARYARKIWWGICRESWHWKLRKLLNDDKMNLRVTECVLASFCNYLKDRVRVTGSSSKPKRPVTPILLGTWMNSVYTPACLWRISREWALCEVRIEGQHRHCFSWKTLLDCLDTGCFYWYFTNIH
jgi:hypothetical protein